MSWIIPNFLHWHMADADTRVEKDTFNDDYCGIINAIQQCQPIYKSLHAHAVWLFCTGITIDLTNYLANIFRISARRWKLSRYICIHYKTRFITICMSERDIVHAKCSTRNVEKYSNKWGRCIRPLFQRHISSAHECVRDRIANYRL